MPPRPATPGCGGRRTRLRRAAAGTGPSYSNRSPRSDARRGSAGADILAHVVRVSERHPYRRVGGCRGGHGRAARPPAPSHPAPVVTGAAAAAPLGLCVAMPRSRDATSPCAPADVRLRHDATRCPTTTRTRLRARVHLDYPVRADRILGLGELPSLRLQRALARAGRGRAPAGAGDQVLVWCALAVVRGPARHRRLHPRAPSASASRAPPRMTYAVFDLGADRLLGAADRAALVRGRCRARWRDHASPACGGMMVEHGEAVLEGRWGPSTVCWEATLSPPCPRCTSRHR